MQVRTDKTLNQGRGGRERDPTLESSRAKLLMLQQKKGWGKNVIVMYTCKDNLTPLLYSGKIKKLKKNTPYK